MRPATYQRRQEPDEVAVERALAGSPVRLRTADRHEVIRRLVARQYHDGQIAHVLGCPRRSVVRTRALLGLEPVISRRAGAHIVPVDAPTRARALG